MLTLLFLAVLVMIALAQPATAQLVYAYDGPGRPGSVVINTQERLLYFVRADGEAHIWPRLPPYVAPGPRNPLAIRAIYLAEGALRIHGTNAPGSIGRAVSSGCFRMHNSHVTQLYELVTTGAPVEVR